MIIPRIRGKVGQAESDDPKFDKKWFFSIWLTTIGGGDGQKIGEWGPFESKEDADKSLKKACQIAIDSLARKIPGAVKGAYIDMKDNQVKRWPESPIKGTDCQ